MAQAAGMTNLKVRNWPFFGSWLIAVAVVVPLSACSVGPDFERPKAPETATYQPEKLPEKTAASNDPGGEAQRLASYEDIPGQWWALFRNKELENLIIESLAA